MEKEYRQSGVVSFEGGTATLKQLKPSLTRRRFSVYGRITYKGIFEEMTVLIFKMD